MKKKAVVVEQKVFDSNTERVLFQLISGIMFVLIGFFKFYRGYALGTAVILSVTAALTILGMALIVRSITDFLGNEL